MGKQKITPHHAELIEFLFVRGVPMTTLAETFDVGTATIERYVSQQVRKRYQAKLFDLVRDELLELGIVPAPPYKE